jgi:hypothetical protein
MFPDGGVMMGGVGGGVTLPASAGGAVIPAKNTRASAAMPALITSQSQKTRFGCNILQFVFVMSFLLFALDLTAYLAACRFRLSLVVAQSGRKNRQPASMW